MGPVGEDQGANDPNAGWKGGRTKVHSGLHLVLTESLKTTSLTRKQLSRPQDSFRDAGEAINDFWSMSGSFIYRHHVEPRVKLYSPREESFPIPLKYIDAS